MKRKIFVVGFFLMLSISIASAEEIKLSTIMSGNVLRGDKGAIGSHYNTKSDLKYKSDSVMDDGWLYMQGGIAIGDQANDGTHWDTGPGMGGSLSIGNLIDIGSGPKLVGGIGLALASIKDWQEFDYLEMTHNIVFDPMANPLHKMAGAGTHLTMGRLSGVDSNSAFRFRVAPNGPVGLTELWDVMVLKKSQVDINATDIYLNGIVHIPGGADDILNSSSSDIRLKKDITTIPDTLERLKSVRGVNFRWKDNKDAFLHSGVIAQEVEKTFPELVRTNKEGMKSILYQELTGVLVEAVNNLKKENDELRHRIEILEKKKGK